MHGSDSPENGEREIGKTSILAAPPAELAGCDPSLGQEVASSSHSDTWNWVDGCSSLV